MLQIFDNSEYFLKRRLFRHGFLNIYIWMFYFMYVNIEIVSLFENIYIYYIFLMHRLKVSVEIGTSNFI